MVRSPLTDVTIPKDVGMAEFVLRRLEGFGDRTAVVDGVTDRSLTYAQICHQTHQLAGALWCKYKLTKGQVVGLILPNCVEYIVLVHGVLLRGATVTTYNPSYKEAELRHQMIDSNTTIVITNKATVDKVLSATKGLTQVQDIIVLDAETSSHNFTAYPHLMRLHGDVTPPKVDIDPAKDIALLLFSSGTTGKPKGVMLTHHNCIATICQFNHPTLENGGPDDVVLALPPVFHVYGMNVVLQSKIYGGAKIIIVPRFEPENFLRCIEKYKVTLLPLAPPTVFFMAEHPLVDKFNIKSVHTINVGGAPLPEEVAQAAYKRLGIDIRQGYGMTEASPGLLSALPGSRPFTNIGVPLSNTEVKVQDINNGSTLPPGEIGEICGRGPQIMKGYLRNREATERTVDEDGWLHTGDLGYHTEEGVFFVVDRLKELIKYKAYQVAPAELESLLLTHPAVGDAAVVGRPNLAAGELPTAFVVTKAMVSTEDIIKFIADKVAPHKQLRGGVIFVDAIPKSPTGKILRRILKERFKNKL